ncbi:HAMP domain-containing protein [Paenibacillus physcomitrellae]|uniref:HAMP domain-containing protein n=1 Tax=Paenibacillus physcomitrellae TaxID=1619311 RepID=A0ABQ1FW94_9BACL|nr:methyl-accepting chemotaxis protein [Paenibacillus physcomitrellae]GGA29703.1 hypothetical protein GCM10010917_13430 [Paenibacillus physcomitrellae]
MMTSKSSLQQQFLLRVFIVLLVIILLSGVTQFYLIHRQIDRETQNQANQAASSLNNGVEETLLASESIEHQIDLKLVAYAKHIAVLLKGKKMDSLSSDELLNIKQELNITGFTVFEPKNDDIVGVASTDPNEIGFSMKQIGFYEAGQLLLSGGKPPIPGATLIENNMVVLPTAQSASHNEDPSFYKYAYYHPPGTDYVINPFIEANEVNQFTETSGPDAWITKIMKENPYLVEAAVLTPKVFADPTLEEKLYPPVKKVVNGSFSYQTESDLVKLKSMAKQPVKQSFVETVEGKKLYKLFVPIESDQVIYIALDYGKISKPLYRHSLISLLFGLLSLIALFMLTARFFSQIYKFIQKIILQIKQLEQGDLTAKSSLQDKGELGDLSSSVNAMADSLHQFLASTHEKATLMQRVAFILEAEADQSVEKALTMSINATAEARGSIDEIEFFLNQVKESLELKAGHAEVQPLIEQIDEIRQIFRDKTNNATLISITLSDLLKSLHGQSSELSGLSQSLLRQLEKFTYHK